MIKNPWAEFRANLFSRGSARYCLYWSRKFKKWMAFKTRIRRFCTRGCAVNCFGKSKFPLRQTFSGSRVEGHLLCFVIADHDGPERSSWNRGGRESIRSDRYIWEHSDISSRPSSFPKSSSLHSYSPPQACCNFWYADLHHNVTDYLKTCIWDGMTLSTL